MLLLAIFTACYHDERTGTDAKPSKAQAKEKLERINRVLVQEDREKIELYIRRHKLAGMNESSTGLFYLIWGNKNGPSVKRGNVVEFNFRVTLLDGTLCYQSKPDSLGTFVVGHGGVESGLEEGILMMKQGQRAKFIMPPHLAHGLIGDANHIPARSIIIYDLELLKVNP